MEDEIALKHVQERLGYQFQNASLLVEALSHSSFVNEQPESAPRDNERLEFLGDAVTSWMVTSLLCETYPRADEGELTRKRASLVCEAGLTSLALELGLEQILRLGKGEEKSGGREKPRLLCSTFEALIGALYLDATLEEFHTLGRQIFLKRIKDAQSIGELDHKSKLQEWLQSQGIPFPIYEVTNTEGPAHDLRFFVSVKVEDKEIAVGEGRSKVEAEQNAAQQALQILQKEVQESE